MPTSTLCKAKVADRISRRLPTILLITLLLGIPAWGRAQANPLNRKISVKVRQKPLDYALDEIAHRGRFNFSYNADLFPTDSVVSLQAQREPVREVLKDIFGTRMVYRSIGNHVVIRSRMEVPAPARPPEAYRLEGFLIDGETGTEIALATVFENYKRTSVLTDERGHYALEIDGATRYVALSFSKRGYRDTVIVVRPERQRALSVGLQPVPGWDQPVASRPVSLVGDRADDIDDLPLVEFLVPASQRKRAFNVQEALRDFPVQVSLVPALGTNKLISGAMNNHFSLNILGGYAHGVRGAEIGGLFNLDRDQVIGFQAGGLFNIVGGEVTGFQAGGLFNRNRSSVNGFQAGGLFNDVAGSITGFQAAGLYNVVRDSVYGVQAGGLFNRTQGHITGLQIGGLYNVAQQGIRGGQLAGIYNHSRGDVQAMQVGGIMNSARHVGLFQVSGVSNLARGSVQGFQVAGLVNIAHKEVSGFQIGGLFNRAQKVDGVQIGLVNVADSVGGVQIGLINLNRDGYLSLEASSNEVMTANLAFKAGHRRFYSVLTAGYRFTAGSTAWSYGGGFGTLVDLGRVTLGFEALCQQINEEGLGPDRLNLVIPGRLSVGLKLGRLLEVYGAASVNLQVTTGQAPGSGEFPSEVALNPFWTRETASTQFNSWVGYQGGLRINLRGMQGIGPKAAVEHE